MTLAQRSKQPGHAPPALPATGTNHSKAHMIREFLNTLPKLAGHPHWGSEHLWGGDTSPMGHPVAPAPLHWQLKWSKTRDGFKDASPWKGIYKSSKLGLPVNSSLLAGLGSTQEPGRADMPPPTQGSCWQTPPAKDARWVSANTLALLSANAKLS